MVAEPCAVQSAQPGSSSEQNVDEDEKLTDSLWAVTRNSDREHKETRQAGEPDPRARSSSTTSRMRSYRSWKTNSAQLRTRVTHHQHSGDETAQHHTRAGRSHLSKFIVLLLEQLKLVTTNSIDTKKEKRKIISNFF